MGLNNEYAGDVNDLEDIDYSCDDVETSDTSVDPQSWQDWHSEHILNMYSTITEYFEMYYRVLNISFNDWNTFLFNRRNALSMEPLYTTNDTWLASLYDQLVTYCEIHELPYLTGIHFTDFQNLIYYRDV
jgi:hypothetical protein